MNGLFFRPFVSFLLFFTLLFLSFPASSQNIPPSPSYQMKFVFPFGDGERHASSVCDMPYRTLDGCCEPPDAVYAYSARVGCCRQPNIPLTIGGCTRCCASAQPNQSRWNQTEASPCGEFCTQPSHVLNSFGKSSCCASCKGARWNQTTASICGNCCSGTSSIYQVGAFSSCCGVLSPDQNRWGQTTNSVCGGYCPPASSIFSYGTLNSCCSSCSEVIAFQSIGNVCGTCCSRVPEYCGTAGDRVCEPITGSAYCSSDITKCNPPTDWIIGSSGEGGFSCCPACTEGPRYGQTESTCGTCCGGTSEMVTSGIESSCCLGCLYSRYSQTATNLCGTCCSSTEGHFAVGHSCSYKPKPNINASCSWEAQNARWRCVHCNRNNAFLYSSACQMNGSGMNAYCSASVGCYSCATSISVGAEECWTDGATVSHEHGRWYIGNITWNAYENICYHVAYADCYSRYKSLVLTATHGKVAYKGKCKKEAFVAGTKHRYLYAGCRNTKCSDCRTGQIYEHPRQGDYVTTCVTLQKSASQCRRNNLVYNASQPCARTGTCLNATCTTAQTHYTCSTVVTYY